MTTLTEKIQMAEEWRVITGFESYEVSNVGNIRNSKTGSLLKPQPNANGYYRVNLYGMSGMKSITVHKIVLETFVGKKPSSKHCGMHLNGVKTDNRHCNLSWGLHSENESHKLIHGTRPFGEKNGSSKLSAEEVIFIRANYKAKNKIFGSKPLSKKFKVSEKTIEDVFHGRRWKSPACVLLVKDEERVG